MKKKKKKNGRVELGNEKKNKRGGGEPKWKRMCESEKRENKEGKVGRGVTNKQGLFPMVITLKGGRKESGKEENRRGLRGIKNTRKSTAKSLDEEQLSPK